MKRIIIISGCDRTGKSTAVKLLRQKLKKEGFNPISFHLDGPNKFTGITFNNDQKSLIQLSKFDTQLNMFKQILNEDQKNIIILDRSHFDQYVWTIFFDRYGKWTDILFQDSFYLKHKDIVKEIIFIYFYVSDLNKIQKKICQSNEDYKIFTKNGKSIKQNIQFVYNLFKDLIKIFNKLEIPYIEFNNDYTIETLTQFLNNNF